MKYLKFLIISSIVLSKTYSQVTINGYLRIVDISDCQDACSQYYLQNEELDDESPGNIIFTNDLLNPNLFLNRYVEVIGEEIFCVECSAIEVSEITISDDCEYPVDCYTDPCEISLPCPVDFSVECIPNFCGGCYADFYDSDGNLVDCSNPPEECIDLSDINFGDCDMPLGFAWINGECVGLSGCDWVVDGIDYSESFFETIEDCISSCTENIDICEDIQDEYEYFHYDIISECEFDNDCITVWGDCDVGLGNCHYAVTESTYSEEQIYELVNMWNENDCMEWVCDCLDLPDSMCLEGYCELAYCYEPNPVGCFQSGCPDGYECIDNANDCNPSWCDCDEMIGEWWCTEDCGGGSCYQIQLPGDLNNDGRIDIIDIVHLVNIILGLSSENPAGDLNQDGLYDVLDVIQLVNIILN